MSDEHQQARERIALADGNDLPADQQAWLREHLRECAACSAYAEAVGRTLSALRSESVAADAGLVQATQMRVRSRAAELRRQRERSWLVCLACLLVGVSAAITTPLFWQTCAWLGQRTGMANWVWQTGFAFLWIAPAMVAGALLLAHGTHLAGDGD